MKSFINTKIPLTVNRFLSKTKSNYFNDTAIVFIKQNNSLYVIDFPNKVFKFKDEFEDENVITFEEYKITYSNKTLRFKLKCNENTILVKVKDAKMSSEWIISNYQDYRVLRDLIEIRCSYFSLQSKRKRK